MSKAFLEEKLLTINAGDNVVRLLPPLIITEDEMNEACECINAACKNIRATEQI